jgi:hypothetical protein
MSDLMSGTTKQCSQDHLCIKVGIGCKRLARCNALTLFLGSLPWFIAKVSGTQQSDHHA